jgi:hypothetical protein
MDRYHTPTVRELGTIEKVTQGQFFSRVDGNSGNTGNQGDGIGGT